MFLLFKEVLEILLNLINKKRLLIPFPLPVAKLSAKFFQLLPKPLLTEDQLRLLKYDNIPSGKYKTNSDIGLPSKLYFKDEVKKYSYMWRDGGEFSTEKYNFRDNQKKKLKLTSLFESFSQCILEYHLYRLHLLSYP